MLKAPKNPLLYVPSGPSRDLAKDLKAAGIPKHTPGGKVDFHACRVAYINMVLEDRPRPKRYKIWRAMRRRN